MPTTSPELNNKLASQKGPESTLYDELAEIARQQREQQVVVEEAAAVESQDQLAETDPISAEADVEQLKESEKYLADLMHHMKSQQPDIYQDALNKIAMEKNKDSEELTSVEDLDTELENKLSKQLSIPPDLLEQMVAEMQGEELRPDSSVWKEVRASGMVGDIARRWRDMYQKAMREVLG